MNCQSPVLVALCLALLTTGCQYPSRPQPLPNISGQPVPEKSPQPPSSVATVVVWPQATPSAPAPLISTAATVDGRLCSQPPRVAHDNIIRQGFLVAGDGNSTWLIGKAPNENSSLAIDNDLSLAVSPTTYDIGWISADNSIRILRRNGETTAVTRPESTGLIDQWLSDNRILLRVVVSDDYLTPKLAIDTVNETSIITGQSLLHTVTMPGYLARGIRYNTWRSIPEYDPHFRFAVYAWQDPVELTTEGLALWNIRDQRIVWEQTWLIPVELSAVDWQADGSRFVTSIPNSEGNPELVVVATDGTPQTVTTLSRDFDYNSEYFIPSLKWSSDGQSIAFVVNLDSPQILDDRWLFVANLASTQTVNLCLNLPRSSTALHWSPDSQQIAFASDDNHRIGIYDIPTATVWYIRLYRK